MARELQSDRPIHFIGIGGIGMSALAIILLRRGFCISGSDKSQSPTLSDLSKEKIKIFTEQGSQNIEILCKKTSTKPLVVISSAIPKDNAELKAAIKAKLEIWHRSDLLAALINNQPSIAVAGSHGKTTTSTIITTLLAVANEDPTAIIGGYVPYLGTNGHAGEGKLLVAEADESDKSLIKFLPNLGVITNLELDHTDKYKDLDELIATIQTFTNNCKYSLGNFDCLTLRRNFKFHSWWSVKTKELVDFAALPKKLSGHQTIAEIYEKGQSIGEISIPLPGIHNLSNAIAAIAACRIEGVSFKRIKEGMSLIKAPERRFDFRGIWNGRQIVDDYAHHPSEIEATLSMARLMLETGQSPLPRSPEKIVVVFQPHRYTRTKKFLKEFAIALSKADSILIAPIYSAGEEKMQGINDQSLGECIKNNFPTIPVETGESLEDIIKLIKNHTVKGDLILTMGAGNINSLWEKLKKHKGSKSAQSLNLAA